MDVRTVLDTDKNTHFGQITITFWEGKEAEHKVILKTKDFEKGEDCEKAMNEFAQLMDLKGSSYWRIPPK